MKIKDKIYIYPAIALLLVAIYQGKTLSQFILDDEEAVVQTEDTRAAEPKSTNEIPREIARNIRAELLPKIRGAVKITWSIEQGVGDDYIVGRTYEAADTPEKALKALSIKVVPAGAPAEAIDSNLSAGTYYYCVISKKKIVENDIELYPGMNFTTTAVTIEKEDVRSAGTLPQQVSLIYARPMNKNRVLITWRGIEAYNIIYTVYRGDSPLDSADKLKRAVIISEITDGRESYVDRSVTQSGSYFYAVTTKDIMGNEDQNLIPDQSYTTGGIILNIGSAGSVTNIQAFAVQGESIKITWRITGSGIAGFVIYRYSKPISDKDRLALAVYVDKVNRDQTFYIDRKPGIANNYYAVLASLDAGRVNDSLVMDENFTSKPVSVGKPIQVNSITAQVSDGDVEITWNFEGSTGDKNYNIIRSSEKPESIEDAEDGHVVEKANIFDKKCFDKKPPPGKYYYLIVPAKTEETEEIEISDGVNVTEEPVVIEKKKPEPETVVKEQDREPVTAVPEVKPEEPVVKIVKKAQWSALDDILINYFFKEDYETALLQLNQFVLTADDSRDLAKARLFIGRSLLELHRYREALDYLILPDVQEHFTDEAKFWTQYVLARLP